MEPQATEPTPASSNTVELVPLALPVEPIDVSLAADPIPLIEALRRSRQRWQLAALLCIPALGLIGVVSCLQFAGTGITCRLLKEARQEAQFSRDEGARLLEENRRYHSDNEATWGRVANAEERLRLLERRWDAAEASVQAALARDEQLIGGREMVLRQVHNQGLQTVGEVREKVTEITREALEQIQSEVNFQEVYLEAAVFKCMEAQGLQPKGSAPMPRRTPLNPFVPQPEKTTPEE
jgi:hypothetical protein